MASMGSSPCLNTETVRPESSGRNSEVLMTNFLSIVETDKVNHTVEIDIVKLVVEIESFGMSADELDKETGSSDGLQPKQANLSCVHALNELHLHEIYVFLSTHEVDHPSIEENGVTRPNKYSELSPTEAIQADCDVKATNIILQGLLPEERECKLYDEFNKFAYKKGETLHDFYLRFSLLLNDMNIYNMKLEQFQVNTKFLNTLPPEWEKFVTDVKLV
nr:hypothetical protein [Tanacetum cinerariifolium]